MLSARFTVATVLLLGCTTPIRVEAENVAPASFKLAFYNIKSGFGQVGLAGVARQFADTSNCTDKALPLNAWGVGAVQSELTRLAADPSVVSLGLAEAWSCARPAAVRAALGWKAVSSERNGVAIVARYGFAGTEEWTQLDTSRNLNPADTMWVLRVRVCLDAACSATMAVFTAHWYSSGLPDADVIAVYETQARQTLAFMSRLAASEPHVLVGDLNAFTGTRPVCEQIPKNSPIAMLSGGGYVDAWTATNPVDPGFTGMWNRRACGTPAGALWKRIDYAWSRDLRPISMTRFGMVEPGHDAPSDHAGIVVEYPMPSPGPIDGRPPLAPGPPTTQPGSPSPRLPSIAVNRTALYFGSTKNGALVTAPQSVIVDASRLPSGTVWTATSDQPWLLAEKDGTGRALSVSIRPGTAAADTLTGLITIAGAGFVTTLPVTLVSYAAPVPAWGVMDTPAEGAANVSGSIAISGWALHQVGVARVDVYRDAVAGESASGLVFIGRAVQVDGARPDLEAAAPLPFNYRAGWGLMVLTNVLPNQGNGTYTFRAIATAADGTSAEIGRKTITCSNASATLPFGAIDSPGQGETVSGTVMNWGWALAPKPSSIPTDGSGIDVYVDGVNLGHPVYNLNRVDVAGLFSDFRNTSGAGGVLPIDTRRLADGVHTIAWFVRDENGHAEGIGSRFFTVQNGLTAASAATLTSASAVSPAANADAAGGGATIVRARHGFDAATAMQEAVSDEAGRRLVAANELDRVEVSLGGSGYQASMLVGRRRAPLPAGSGFDAATGTLTWQPGLGFAGRYDFLFTRGAVRIPLTVLLTSRPLAPSQVELAIDTPTVATRVLRELTIAGWAVDRAATSGTGVDAVHIWAYPSAGGEPIFLGAAAYGGQRPDVASAFGREAEPSGFGLSTTALPAGSYDVAVFPHSTVSGDFAAAKVVRVIVN